MSGKSMTVGLVVVVVLVGGGYLLMRGNSGSVPEISESPVVMVSVSPTPSAEVSASPSLSPTPTPAASAMKTFKVTGTNFAFDLKEIKVSKGDTVKIVFTNTSGFHDWVIDEFNARTSQIGAGKTETIQFVASKTGTFEYYCSVGNHRAQGMKGNLIVQ